MHEHYIRMNMKSLCELLNSTPGDLTQCAGTHCATQAGFNFKTCLGDCHYVSSTAEKIFFWDGTKTTPVWVPAAPNPIFWCRCLSTRWTARLPERLSTRCRRSAAAQSYELDRRYPESPLSHQTPEERRETRKLSVSICDICVWYNMSVYV